MKRRQGIKLHGAGDRSKPSDEIPFRNPITGCWAGGTGPLHKFLLGVVLVSAIAIPVRALSPFNIIGDWPCVAYDERLTVASMLAVVAGRGRAELNEEFFVRCIDDLAYNSDLLKKRISDAANGCVIMNTLPYTD